MFSLIWLLVGIIIGMLLMFLVIASYEEHAVVKLVRHRPIGIDDNGNIQLEKIGTDEIPIKKKKSLKI